MTGERFSLVATAGFGLEAVVSRELAALGYEARGASARPGWVRFEADAAGIARANVFLRAADRVLLEIEGFRATDFGMLFDQTRAVPWERLLPRSASFPVKGRSVKSVLGSVPACQRIVKKAIVERLREAYGVRTLPEDGPVFPVEVSLLRDEARLTLDTSGTALHRRGYRPEVGRAPLKETLAAGLVLLSFWNRDRPFLDPFCGTGTIAIEAALIARKRAPGAGRSFAAEAWPSLPSSAWKRAREEARALEDGPLATPLGASDADARELGIARESAARAGVASDIRFESRAFEDLPGSGDETGCLVANPPYGDRMGEEEELRRLYRAMPDVFRRFPHWSFYVLTARRDLERTFGQTADRRRKLYNGRIECTYYQFHGPRGRARPDGQAPSESASPAFGGVSEKSRRQVELFANRLRKRAHHLRRWPDRRATDAYRIYDGDIKEVPVVVDRYGESYFLRTGPHRVTSRSRAEQAAWLEAMAETAARTLGVLDERIVLPGRAGDEVVVAARESGLVFEVRLGGEETGLPIPQRALRSRLREKSRHRRVLVLFTRAGALTVAAAAGGASSITSVDRSRSRLDWTMRNLRRNELAGDRHAVVEADVLDFLREDSGPYDLAAVHLPRTLPRAALPELFDRLASRCAADAVVLLTSDDDRYRPREHEIPGWRADEITEELLAEDVRGARGRRAWRLEKTGKPA